ncbi:glycosyl transferase group 1 [Chloroherpeton thalassium ATCC 35110]|uniref:Glycosyl transferase group 1 n=1 Tax=Chloroherpeton thalassium (strain ATCC 35110 / GB-78) TaxID=517418 RepID=B3QYV4_CHLT3|nr:glycosyltransferase [Chloroherpeton thalassium]ACF15177.1 glycosyl transferase group 1 [Chloroherpeton thalassium ATCC 35110]
MPHQKSLATGTHLPYTLFFVNKFNWLDASPMATVSTFSTYALAEQGQHTTLIIEGDTAAASDELLKEKFGLAPRPNYRVKLLQRKIFGKVKSSEIFFLRAVGHILKNSPDGKRVVVITRNTTFLFYLVMLKKLFGFTVLFEAHGYHGTVNLPNLPLRPPLSFLQRYSSYRLLEQFLLNQCSGLICITRPQCQLYRADFVKIPTAVLPLGSRPPEMKTAALPQFSKKRLVYIGRLTTHIDVDLMIQAIKAIASDGISLVWVGLKSGDIEVLAKKIREAGLPEGAFLLKGWMAHKDMAALLREETSVGLATYKPTYRSAVVTCPTKIFDYYAVGLPVIAAKLPTVEDLVTDGHHGVLYDTANAHESLVAAISRLCTDEALYSKMQASVLAAAEYFSWQNRAKRLISFAQAIQSGNAQKYASCNFVRPL